MENGLKKRKFQKPRLKNMHDKFDKGYEQGVKDYKKFKQLTKKVPKCLKTVSGEHIWTALIKESWDQIDQKRVTSYVYASGATLVSEVCLACGMVDDKLTLN